ncbi:MAG TPA: M56 family metallopeptidase [Terriglobales bacterium]
MTDVLNTLAQGSLERMVDSLVQGSALALAAFFLLRIFPREKAATRFLIWLSTLAGVVALPFLNGFAAVHGTGVSGSLLTLPPSLARILFLAWIVFAIIAIARLVFGLIDLATMRRNCRPVQWSRFDSETRAIIEPSLRKRNIEILSSDALNVPTAIGFVRPGVIIPEKLLRELSASELKQVLLHELAHLSRWDDWSNLLLQLLKAVFWFHPAVWWINRRIALEREMACDDAVLAAAADRRAYALCLARLAESNFASRTAALVQAAVSRVHQTTLRVSRILQIGGDSPATAHKTALAATASFIFAATAVVAHPAGLISFAGDRTPVVAHSAGAGYYAGSLPLHVTQAHVTQVWGRSTTADVMPRTMLAKLSSRSTVHSAPMSIHHAVLKTDSRTEARAPRVVHTSFSPAAGHLQNNQSTGTLLVYYTETWESHSTTVWRLAMWQIAPATPSQASAPNEPSRKSI